MRAVEERHAAVEGPEMRCVTSENSSLTEAPACSTPNQVDHRSPLRCSVSSKGWVRKDRPNLNPGVALSVWTSKGDDKPGRIRGPWWTHRTLDVHLTPGIRAPRNPGSLTLSGGPARLQASRGAPASDPCSVCGALWRPHAGTPHTLQMTRWAGEQAPA